MSASLHPSTLWARGIILPLAKHNCASCRGAGLRFYVTSEAGEDGHPCGCVLRAAFRACMARFRYFAENQQQVSTARLQLFSGRSNSRSYGRPAEEFMADLILIARRTLDHDQWRIFRFHYLLGADWRLCTKRLGMDRGQFFHEVYRIEALLGTAFIRTEPHALYPPSEYLGGLVTRELLPAREAPAAPAIGPRGGLHRDRVPLRLRPAA